MRLSYRTLCEILLNPDLFVIEFVQDQFPKNNEGFFQYFQKIVDSGIPTIPTDLKITREGTKITKIELEDFVIERQYYLHIPGVGLDEPFYIDNNDQIRKSNVL